jgi:hypothetical protein
VKNKNSEKKGIAPTTVVGVVLLIIGVGILLMFLYRIQYSELAATEACRESVTLRAASLGATYKFAELVPLNCKTSKICITNGGECKSNFPGETILTKKVKTSNDISKAIADQVLSCWDMMGQGRLALIPEGFWEKFGFGEAGAHCTICSRIALDKETLKTDMDKADVYSYMVTRTVPGKDFTYAQYIAQGSPTGLAVTPLTQKEQITGALEKTNYATALQTKEAEGKLTPISEADRKAELSKITIPENKDPELAVMYVQVAGTGLKRALGNSALLGGTAFLSPAGKVATVTVTAVAAIIGAPVLVVGLVVGAIAVVGVGGPEIYFAYRNYEVSMGYCGDVSFGKGIGEDFGCNAVRIVPYNLENLKSQCNVIESIP